MAGAILDDVGAEPGALALVEFALAELYERGGGESMTADAYRALGRQDGANGNTGGIGGVIDRQAEQSVQDDQGRVDDSTLSKIFPLLADVDEKGGAVRKRAKLNDFVGPERAHVDRLVNGRLLLTNREEGAAAWVEVAHEAVLRDWQRFQTWLKENQKFLLWRQSLKHWMKRKTPLPSAELNEGEAWRKKLGRDALTTEEKAYLTKSRWNLRWQRAKLGVLLTVVGAGVAGANWWLEKEQLSARAAAYLALNEVGLYGLIEPEMVRFDCSNAKPCELNMGSTEYSGEEPQHKVTLTKAFALAKYELTFDEYAVFARTSDAERGCSQDRRPAWEDAGWGVGHRPAINVSWDDATCFAAWLTRKRGLDDKHRYRLPTEAEWEYAARAGTTTRYWWGDEVGKNNANCAGCGSQWDGKQTAPVGSFQPNGFGLHDMLGNVWEWVQDCWLESYKGAPTDGSAWGKQQGGNCAKRVIGGGSWGSVPESLRSALWSDPATRDNFLGCRLAQDN